MAKLASPLRGGLIRTGKYGKRGEVPVGGGKVSSTTHLGVDVRAAVGTPFYPLEPGVVVQTRKGWQSHSRPGTSAGSRIFTDSIAGNLTVVRGATGDIIYNHAAAIAVNVGQQVGLDTMLGTTGTSGGVAPHLHVGIWPRDRTGKWGVIDPTPLLPWTGDKFGELTIEEDEDEMNNEDRKWLQKALNDTEDRIRADMRANVTEQVSKALAAAEGARDALVKPVDGFAPIDVIRTHAVATLKAVREQAAGQGVKLDERKLADGVLDALGKAIVDRD